MAGEERVDLLALGPGQECVEGGAEMFGSDGGEAGFAQEVGGEPIGAGGEGVGGEVGPGGADGMVQEAGAGAQGALILGPGESVGAAPDSGFCEESRGGLKVFDGGGVVSEAQGVEAWVESRTRIGNPVAAK
jgi:hypothetical protein